MDQWINKFELSIFNRVRKYFKFQLHGALLYLLYGVDIFVKNWLLGYASSNSSMMDLFVCLFVCVVRK